jgi:hypothetical protein
MEIAQTYDFVPVVDELPATFVAVRRLFRDMAVSA